MVETELYPLPSQIMFIWHVFVERIDPFVKILHIPSLTDTFHTFSGDWASLKPGVSALVLVVSFAVVSVLDSQEVKMNFAAEKKDIVARFRKAVEQALERAELLVTDDLRAVEAFIIYLSILQNNPNESDIAWTLLGLLIRVAVRLQLHQDNDGFDDGTSDFDKERRRRLWWQICLIDGRAASPPRSSQFSISEDMFSTTMPSNINDVDLSPDTNNIYVTECRRTDMTASLIRYKLWRLSRQIRSCIAASAPDPSRALAMFRRGVLEIKETHMVHLNTGNAIDSLITTMAELSFARIELILQQRIGFSLSHPLNGNADTSSFTEPPNPQTSMYTLAVTILELTWALNHEPRWRPWRWVLGRSMTPWNALEVTLRYICSTPWKDEYQSAWAVAKKSFDEIADSAKSTPHYISLRMLVERTGTAAKSPNRADVVPDMGICAFSSLGLSVTPRTGSALRAGQSRAPVMNEEAVLEEWTIGQNWDILPDSAWDLEDWVNI